MLDSITVSNQIIFICVCSLLQWTTEIMTISLDSIQHLGKVPMDEREAMLYHYVAKRNFNQRNQHMKGTTIALQETFNIGKNSEHISVNGVNVHIFEAFALVNVVLCSRCNDRKRESKVTEVMRNNCINHFIKTVEILQPTLIIFQGIHISRLFSNFLKTTRVPISVTQRTNELGEITSNEMGSMVLCKFRHPARNWFSRQSDYYIKIVAPTILQARRILGI